MPRHPLMAGFLIAFWAAPTMTQRHLLFAGPMTAYVLFGIRIEEKDLLQMLGEDCRRYHARTPMLIPGPRRAHAPAPPLRDAARD